MANKREHIPTKLRRAIYIRDFGHCRYCSEFQQYKEIEIDHVVAVANGGGSGTMNLVTSCFKCNRSKSDSEGWVPDKIGVLNWVAFCASYYSSEEWRKYIKDFFYLMSEAQGYLSKGKD